MPKDSSIKSVLIIGSGPIVIGQACEFDYAGSQAARSLREEGIEVILINSNPAKVEGAYYVDDFIEVLKDKYLNKRNMVFYADGI